MLPAPDPACPTTPGEVVIHGANAVCGVPANEAHDPRQAAALGVGGALAFAFGLALIRRGGASPARVAVLLMGAAAVAAPGLRAVLVERADAPLRAPASAEKIETLVREVDAFATERRDCLEEVHDNCVECEPMLRFVLPAVASCEHPRGKIELGPDALASGCVVRGDTLACGTPSTTL